ncbi:ABC transporter permease [Ornithinibacillus massiliensis]|uniref:ABC transporter permease n=1 Tax=Ornithinibacillus massiliensis TaxID=1944633 RepID=A0ABS5MF06_9BACI|nr:ABC transporter permease [Ornithinibacillus massiliensis]MBS3680909.1 ABC transporter permease [Ornithinibacillus massiliensis]
MNVLNSFFKQKETLIGIAAAIAFQLIFVFIWLTAYDGVYDRTDQFKIGIINDDIGYGEEIVEQLEQGNLFQITKYSNLHLAQKELDDRNINMLIHFPNQLTENILANENASIDYYINQSTATLTKQMMEKIAGNITGQVNQQVQQAIKIQIADHVPQMLAEQSENKHVVEQVTSQLIDILQSSSNPSIHENVMKINDKEGFAPTMVPLLIVLASYIGAMLVSQHLQLSEGKLTTMHSKSSLFIGRQIINVLVAIGVSLLTVCLMYLFHIDINQNFFVLWGFQALLMFSFLTLSQVFVMLFGNIGMIFNIALTASQLVSSGAIVPRELLSSFYQGLGDLLPATYGVNSYFSLIYGGGNVLLDMKYLSIIIASLLVVTIFGKIIQHLWKRLQPIRTTES